MSLISATGLSVRVGDVTALSDVNFTISAGEIVKIVGPNGSGKSSFLRALIGAVAPLKGTVTRQPNLKIGYVPQKLDIDATLPLTVRRFMSLPRRRSASEIDAALREAEVAGLADRQMSALSGGQFQRVLLARAVMEKPDILILDEATQGLDQPGSGAFYRKIADLRDRLNCAVLMVSHELHVVMSTSDRVICLNGHICCEGAPDVVVSAPEYRALFGSGTGGALALYRHEHSHSHDHSHNHPHEAAE